MSEIGCDREFFLYKSEHAEPILPGDMQEIWSRIEDSVSAAVFSNRLSFSLLLDNSFLGEVWKETEEGLQVYNQLKNFEGKLYIYAAGRKGIRLKEAFPDITFCKFIDKHCDRVVCDIPVISLAEFAEEYVPFKTKIIISCANFTDEIFNDLCAKGVERTDILVLEKLSSAASKDIYFEERCVGDQRLDDGFVDVGAYRGETTVSYYRYSNNPSAATYVFEPERENYEKCKDKLRQYANASIYNCGVSDHTEDAFVISNGDASQIVSAKDDVSEEIERISLVSLDDLLAEKKVGYVKIDVEGFEENVIRGAKRIIAEQKPVLAVSVYHKQDDIWKLPKLILDICPNYSFRFGHYTLSIGDTVMYCIPNCRR